MNPYLNRYISLVDFLADTFGRNTEVVLHDTSDCANSIVAIRNGHISGRQKGAPLTDLGLKILKEADEQRSDYVTGLIGHTADGRVTKSSAWTIRDDSGKIAGLLCVNIDYSELKTMQEVLQLFADKMELPILPKPDQEIQHFSRSVSELVEHNLKKAWPDYGREHPKLSQKEKMEIVFKLNEMGTFYMKGAVAYTAEQIGSSVPTIYRYLSTFKNKSEE